MIVMLLLLTMVILSACGSLTNSQLAAVNHFGQLSKTFSAYSDKLYPCYLDIHEKALLYNANANTDPAVHYDLLSSAYDLKRRLNKEDQKLALIFKIIESYGEALVLLTSDQHAKLLGNEAEKAGNHLDGLINRYNGMNTRHTLPKGIGALLSGLFSKAGDVYIHKREAEKLKVFVQEADPMVSGLADELSAYLSGNFSTPAGIPVSFQDLITLERKEIENDYKTYLGYNDDKIVFVVTDTVNHKINHRNYTGTIQKRRFVTVDQDKDWMRMMTDLDNLDSSYKETLISVNCLKNTHHDLLLNIQKKKTLKELIEAIEEYDDHIVKMCAAIKIIKR